MYLSKTETGNQTELVPHYGEWNIYNTYKFSDVQSTNLLDITDDAVRQQLGTQFEQLTKVFDIPFNATNIESNILKAKMYEFTNEISKWARQNNYNGLIVPGARGAKNYENVIIFEQNYADQILLGKTPFKIIK